MKNLVGKSDFLRGLAPGESAVWNVKGKDVEKEMRLFTATACRLAVTITQRAALLVMADNIPLHCVIVTKVK
ncbi:hypothetical protein [Salmonella phage SSBI34]|nr:hypothetical protein [Salmonella phage SSBI34]